jgi:hypothetical protein
MAHTQEEVLRVFEGARAVIGKLGVEYKRRDLQDYIERGMVEPWALDLWDRWIEQCYKDGKPYKTLLGREEKETGQMELFV